MYYLNDIQHKDLLQMTDVSSLILNSQGFGLIIIDGDTSQIVYANSKLFEMSGFLPENIIGKKCNNLLCPAQENACPIRDLGQTVDNSERVMFNKDGEKIPIIKTVIPINKNGKKYFVESLIDISLQKDMRDMLSNTNRVLKDEVGKRTEIQKKLETLAYYDYLTGLPNRVLCIERITHALTLAECSATIVAIMFLDLDGFKMINDTAGHFTGDELLVQVAKRLVSTTRKSDTVARIGGDEFVIVFENIESNEGIQSIMQKILAAFQKPFTIRGQDFFVTASLGVAVQPEDGNDAENLIQNADIAMYKAKERGRNQGIFCNSLMKQNVTEYMKLSNQLYRAIEKNELILYYQPQINCCDRQVVGMEALLRWKNPKIGLVPPGKFIPIAEKTGLIHSLGDWVLRTACVQNKIWQDKGLPKVPIAVNLSALQFNNRHLAKNVSAILNESGLPPKYLELEITESVVVRELLSVVEMLNSFRNLGVSIAIDDFGTDYSSLQYLKQLPIDRLKIAMPFVQGIAVNQQDEAITQAILLLAKKMNLRVIAEGVETKNQLSFLKQYNCQDAQGFYFYKPLPAEEMELVLKNGVPIK